MNDKDWISEENYNKFWGKDMNDKELKLLDSIQINAEQGITPGLNETLWLTVICRKYEQMEQANKVMYEALKQLADKCNHPEWQYYWSNGYGIDLLDQAYKALAKAEGK